MKTYQLIILFLLTTFIAQPVLAQVKSQPIYHGFLVKENNDTISGKLKMLSPTLNEVKVKITDKNNKTVVYKAKDVTTYSFQVTVWNSNTRIHEIHWVTYRRKPVERAPIPFGPTNALLLEKESGSISLYHHYIEYNNNPDSPMGLVMYLQQDNGEMEEITKENYRKLLKEMTKDYPALQAKVGTKNYRFNQISTIIVAYNHWKEDRTSEIALE